MPDMNEVIHELIIKYLEGNLDETERKLLEQWVAASVANKQLFDRVTDEPWVNTELRKMYAYDEERGWEKINSRLAEEGQPLAPAPKPAVRQLWWRIAAACALVAVVVGSYFLLLSRQDRERSINSRSLAAHDIKAPAVNRAVITLADNSVIYLDSSSDGELALQGNARLLKLSGGHIAYEMVNDEVPVASQYNTLTNPRGSQVIDMSLADGSHVWLNAGSSITFPVAFAGNERKVSVNGEVYFEVAHDASRPFRVDMGGKGTVEVLGTHFNINSYDDESVSKVTLIEGAVKVIKGATSRFLSPGQQAQVADQVSVFDNADLEEVMAWKNGKFLFNNTDIRSTMRQVARWYDVEIVYQGDIDGSFNGTISRSENVSTLLQQLQMTEEAHFGIVGKKILVKP